MAKVRADDRLVELGFAESRAKAAALILTGEVFQGDRNIATAGALLASDAELRIRGAVELYVSRGGVKLAGALRDFGVNARGLRCMDVGASTGGFTDCLLAHGAREVVAVDVAYGMLAHKLRGDSRVINMERTNARELMPEAMGGTVDLTVVDASFISLSKLMAAIARCTRTGGELVALIKPQFEAARFDVRAGGGVIRDEQVRRAAIDSALEAVRAEGFEVLGDVDCVIPGPKGNREAFVWARRVNAY